MAAEPARAGGRGPNRVDWEQAFLFYAGLSPGRRSYRAVAEEFGVSERTVERPARKQHWQRRAAELDRQAAEQALEQLRQERAERMVETEKLVDATLVMYANQLVAGQVKVTPAHVVKMVELRERLWEQHDVTAEPNQQPPRPVVRHDESEHRLAVLRALCDAGVLPRLFDTDAAEPTDDEHRDGDEGEQEHDRGSDADQQAVA